MASHIRQLLSASPGVAAATQRICCWKLISVNLPLHVTHALLMRESPNLSPSRTIFTALFPDLTAVSTLP